MIAVPQLHLVTPATVDATTLAAVETAVAVGGSQVVVQVRVKSGTDRQRLDASAVLAGRARAGGATVLVDDRVDIALAIGAAGVHVGDDDVPVDVARRLLGPDAIVGATCRNPDAARRAETAGASYLGVGPAYATSTKAGLPDPIGPAGVGAVAAAVDLPVIAIAGITAARIPELRAAGAHGVAVVGAVFSADDPGRATKELLVGLEAGP